MNELKIEKTYYPNGQIEREESFKNGIPHGLSKRYYPNGGIESERSFENGIPHGWHRTWHENGVLASEVYLNHEVPDGIARQWDTKGNLLGTFEIKNGTGIEKKWYEDGTVENEISWVNGTTTGRWRMYEEDGTILGDMYWIKNRKVSKKKYIEACQKDPTLPRYDDIEVKKKLPAEKAIPEPDNDDFCKGIISSGKAKEAREWFKSAKCFLGEATNEEDSVELVESLYKAGVVKVWVFDINIDKSGEQYSGRLIIEMPKNSGKRKKIFSICDEIAENLGFDAEEDCGQRYRLLMLD